jgi:tetratricopeptide (TPR) repeat protein
MKIFRSKAFLLPLLLSGVFLVSCVTQKKASFEPLLSQSRQYFETGEFQKAIYSYTAASKKYPNEKTILKEYSKTLEEIKQKADKAFDKKDFVSAERVYSVLLKNGPQFKPVEKSLSFTPQLLSQRIRDCRIRLSESQAQQSLLAGDFQKALDLYKAAYEEYNNDAGLSADLRKTMEDIKRLADKALAKEDFISAGKAYSVLGKDYPFYQKVAQPPAFSRGSLEEELKKCRTQLTQKGLEQYRKGNLAEAISLWQGILLFDPENIEIKKAIDTATQQLKKIQKK